MITSGNLNAHSYKDLARMAKQKGITGWHAMRKCELVAALVKAEKTRTPRKSPVTRSTRPTAAQRKIRAVHAHQDRLKDLASSPAERDRLILMVRDPYWLQATWELRPNTVQRARAALAENWHNARPVLRLIRIPAARAKETQPAEVIVRDVEIHGAVSTWFIDVSDPPTTFRAEIGYLAGTGEFRSIARSNAVTTPEVGKNDALEDRRDIVENSERIYALSGGYADERMHDELREYLEEQRHRPLGHSSGDAFLAGQRSFLRKKRQIEFSVNAEMIVYGSTEADAQVTLGGEPLEISPDGSFSIRISLPDRRQVIPVVASTKDGKEKTVVIAVERNTKVLETRIHESA